MNILYLCLLLGTHMIHASELQYENSMFIANHHNNRRSRLIKDVKRISDKISPDSTLKDLRVLHNSIELKKQRYQDFAFLHQSHIDSLDKEIVTLQSNHLCHRSHNSLWAHWQNLKERLKKYQALSPQQKMQVPQLGHTPWYCITQDLYWGMLINSASLTFYKQYGYSVELLELEREKILNLVQEKIADKRSQQKQKDVLHKYIDAYDKMLENCCNAIEEKAIKGIIPLQSIVRKNNAKKTIDAMRLIKKTRAQAAMVHEELLQCVHAQQQKIEREAQAKAQLQEEQEQKTEKILREQARKQAQRQAHQDALAAKKAQEEKLIAQQQQARKEQSARDKAKIKAQKDQQKAAEEAAKEKSDAELAALTILASLPSQSQPINLIHTVVSQKPIEQKIQKLIRERRMALENCGTMDESLRCEIDIYDKANNLFTDTQAGPAQLVYLLQDLLESSSHRSAMLFDNAYEKIVALDAVLRSNSQEHQLSMYLKSQKKLYDSMVSRLEFLKNKSKDYPSLDELDVEMQKIMQKNKDINLAIAITLPGVALFGDNVKKNTMLDAIRSDSMALRKKKSDFLDKMNDMALIYRLTLLLDFIDSSSRCVGSLEPATVLKEQS